MAEFLCELAAASEKPRSHIKVAVAALSNMYKAMNMDIITDDPDIRTLITGLVKGGTREPMARTSAMPVERFVELFSGWPGNNDLDVSRLRLKAVTLLALTLCLRPSDIAPKSVSYDPLTGTSTKNIFTRDMITVLSDSAQITLFGIKNDLQRQGFQLKLPRHPVQKLCQVAALESYMDHTKSFCSEDNGVFLTLLPPYSAISARRIGKIMDEAIKLAGLPAHYTPKYFRPTGATQAIESGQDPEVVRKIGRWKSSHVFYEHYVHSRTPTDYVTGILPVSVDDH